MAPRVKAGLRSLSRHYLRSLGFGRASLSLLLCGNAEIRRLNLKFRRKNKATDVLSFPLVEGRVRKGYAGSLGDLAISLPYVKAKAGRFGLGAADDLALLLLHGICHLTGWHHDNKAQEAALWRLKRRHFPPPPRLLKALAF